MRLSFELTGLTPLLLHNDDVDMADMLNAWRKDPKNKNLSKPGDDRSPPWTWQAYLYHDGEHVCLPSDNLWTCFREAAASVPMKGQKSFKESAAAGIYFEQEFLPIKVDGGRQVELSAIEQVRDNTYPEQIQAAKSLGFELFAKRARVGTSKHIRVRPRFVNWRLSGTVLVTADELTLEVLNSIGDIAGRYKGVGDGRPSAKKPWPYGKFQIQFSEA